MERIIIPFTTQEAWLANRVQDLTSSDVPCLFGCGYQNYEELLEHKRSKILPNIEKNERMEWGIALQDSIAKELARIHKLDIYKKTEYIRIPSLRLGSSFDWTIHYGGVIQNSLLEIKNVAEDSYKKWLKGFEIEATPYIEIQVQHQLLVSGLENAYIGCLIGGCKSLVLHRKANKKIQEAILIKAEKFWREVDENNNN